MSSEWDLLSKVYGFLNDGNVLETPETEPIVRFEHPENLKKIIDFSIDSNESINTEEIEQICRQVIKYSVKTCHPHFHNQLFGAVDPYGLVGSWITEGLNTSQYTYEVGPVFTLIEDAVLSKVLKLVGFENGDGIFCPGASISNMYGMIAARYKCSPDIKKTGNWNRKPLVAFTSEDAHYSLTKIVNWLGIGTDNLVSVKTDYYGRMIPEELNKSIEKVIKEGRQPFFVNSTAGTTVLGAFDEFDKIAEVCNKHNVWLHVDAAYGGSTLFSERSYLMKGVNMAKSISWNPHKVLGAPLQCSMFLINEKGLLHECNSANAKYLFQQDKFYDVAYDLGDKSVQCGRKVDAFKIWLMFKARGNNEIQSIMNNTMNCADYFTEKISKRSGFRLVIDKFQFTSICFWYIPKKMRDVEETQEWWNLIYKIPVIVKEKMIKSGTMMVGYSPLNNKGHGNFFRMVVMAHPRPNSASMDFVIDEIEKLAEETL